eukprot:gene15977-22107_t
MSEFRKRYAQFKDYVKTVQGFLGNGGELDQLFAWQKGHKEESMSYASFYKLKSGIKVGISLGKIPTPEDMACTPFVDELLASSPIMRAMRRPASTSPLAESPLETRLGAALRRFGAGPTPSSPHQHSPSEPAVGLMEHLHKVRLEGLEDSALEEEVRSLKVTTARNEFFKAFVLANLDIKVNTLSPSVNAAWEACHVDRKTRFEAISKIQNKYIRAARSEGNRRGLTTKAVKRKHAKTLPGVGLPAAPQAPSISLTGIPYGQGYERPRALHFP